MSIQTAFEAPPQPKDTEIFKGLETACLVELSVVMPCLNEAETLEICIRKAQHSFRNLNVSGEVLIADNGSTDGSQEIAFRTGARLVHVEQKGYGAALIGGVREARGKFIIMGDADDSYDFENLAPFLEKLRAGYELVMGNRFKGGIKSGAMPLLHRYLGNPVLTMLGRVFFGSPCGDFHCGLRGFSKTAIMGLNLRTTGMEFASEMVVKATLQGMRIAEVPTILSPDGRTRPPHLRTWRDGWRHLRFLLLYCPRWLFLYPGAALMAIGVAALISLIPGPRTVGGISFDVHTMLYAALAMNVGFQAVNFALFTKTYAITEGLLPEDPVVQRLLKYMTLEAGLITGGLLIVLGILGSTFAVSAWGAQSFGPLDPSKMLRLVVPAASAVTLGFQIVLSSFFLSVLGLRPK